MRMGRNDIRHLIPNLIHEPPKNGEHRTAR